MKQLTKALILLILLLVPLSAVAQERVYDYAQVFTTAEKQEITDAVNAFIGDTGMDYAVLTVDRDIGSQTHYEVAREYYRSLGLGTGEDHSGALYYLNFNTLNRYEYLYTDGQMIDYMNDVRIELALDQSNPLLKQELYADAVLTMITVVKNYVAQGIPSNQFRFDADTGEILSVNESADAPEWMKTVQSNMIKGNPEGEYRYDPETDTIYFVKKKHITMTELLIGAAVCLLIGAAFILTVASRYKLKGSTYHYDYYANSNVDMKDSDDQYLRTTVTRTRRVQTGGGGGGRGGGFSGGGGGSSVHSGGGGGGGRGF
jgi:uncharacterized protein